MYPYSVPGTASLVNVTLNMRYKNDKNIILIITRFLVLQTQNAPKSAFSQDSAPDPLVGWEEIPLPISLASQRFWRIGLGAVVGSQAPSTQITGYASVQCFHSGKPTAAAGIVIATAHLKHPAGRITAQNLVSCFSAKSLKLLPPAVRF